MVSTKERIDDYLFRHDEALSHGLSLHRHDIRFLSDKAIIVLTLRSAGYGPWQIAKLTGIPEDHITRGLEHARAIYRLTTPVLKAFAVFADCLDDIETEIHNHLFNLPARRKAVSV